MAAGASGLNIPPRYQQPSLLHNGQFSTVCKVWDSVDRTDRALKITNVRTKMNSADGKVTSIDKLLVDVDVLSKLRHPHIVAVYDCFVHLEIYLTTVMESADGGHIYQHILRHENYTEQEASRLCWQVLQALEYLHNPKRNLVHRNVAPENVLMAKDPVSGQMLCKLTKFSGVTSPSSTSPNVPQAYRVHSSFIAPEAMTSRPAYSEDLYSMGCFLFAILSGRLPHGPWDATRMKAFDFFAAEGATPHSGWLQINPKAKGLLLTMMSLEPRERGTASLALQNPWLQWTASQASWGNLRFVQEVLYSCGAPSPSMANMPELAMPNLSNCYDLGSVDLADLVSTGSNKTEAAASTAVPRTAGDGQSLDALLGSAPRMSRLGYDGATIGRLPTGVATVAPTSAAVPAAAMAVPAGMQQDDTLDLFSLVAGSTGSGSAPEQMDLLNDPDDLMINPEEAAMAEGATTQEPEVETKRSATSPSPPQKPPGANTLAAQLAVLDQAEKKIKAAKSQKGDASVLNRLKSGLGLKGTEAIPKLTEEGASGPNETLEQSSRKRPRLATATNNEPVCLADNIRSQVNMEALLRLQVGVASHLREAYNRFQHVPSLSRAIRLSAVSARAQQSDCYKTIVKFERTAQAVLGLLPDLNLAMEESEPNLCHDIFEKVAGWVRDMKADTLRTQECYVKITMEVNNAIEIARQMATDRRDHLILHHQEERRLAQRVEQSTAQLKKAQGDLAVTDNRIAKMRKMKCDAKQETAAAAKEEKGSVSYKESNRPSQELNTEYLNEAEEPETTNLLLDEEVLSEVFRPIQEDADDLASALPASDFVDFMAPPPQAPAHVPGPYLARVALPITEAAVPTSTANVVATAVPASPYGTVQSNWSAGEHPMHNLDVHIEGAVNVQANQSLYTEKIIRELSDIQDESDSHQLRELKPIQKPSYLETVLGGLQEVDKILTKLANFWSGMEIALDTVLREGDRAESLVNYMANQRFKDRLVQRLREFSHFWATFMSICKGYTLEQARCIKDMPEGGLYEFLTTKYNPSLSTDLAHKPTVGHTLQQSGAVRRSPGGTESPQGGSSHGGSEC